MKVQVIEKKKGRINRTTGEIIRKKIDKLSDLNLNGTIGVRGSVTIKCKGKYVL